MFAIYTAGVGNNPVVCSYWKPWSMDWTKKTWLESKYVWKSSEKKQDWKCRKLGETRNCWTLRIVFWEKPCLGHQKEYKKNDLENVLFRNDS